MNDWHVMAPVSFQKFLFQSVMLLLTQAGDVLVIDPASECGHELTQQTCVLVE
jgi:hypothetical protein